MGTTYALLAAAAAVAVLIVMYILIGRKTPPAPPAAACGGDADCGPRQTCVQGVCVSPAACGGTNPCPSGQKCVDGVCMDIADCVVNKDCGKGKHCVGGKCHEVGYCESAKDCEGSDRTKCVGNRCVNEVYCEQSSDCAENAECRNNMCKVIRYSECKNDYYIANLDKVGDSLGQPTPVAGKIMCAGIFGGDTKYWPNIEYADSQDCSTQDTQSRKFSCYVPDDPKPTADSATRWTGCSTDLWRGRAPSVSQADLVCKGIYGPDYRIVAGQGQLAFHDCGYRGGEWYSAQYGCQQ